MCFLLLQKEITEVFVSLFSFAAKPKEKSKKRNLFYFFRFVLEGKKSEKKYSLALLPFAEN
jgi:hypothetical protein